MGRELGMAVACGFIVACGGSPVTTAAADGSAADAAAGMDATNSSSSATGRSDGSAATVTDAAFDATTGDTSAEGSPSDDGSSSTGDGDATPADGLTDASLDGASDSAAEAGDGSTAAGIRFGLLTPPTYGNYDFCFETSAGWVGPVAASLGLDGGLSSGQMTKYLTFQGQGDVGVMMLNGTEKVCTGPGGGPVTSIYYVAAPPGSLMTAVGFYDADPSIPLGIGLFKDDTAGDAQTAKVRAVDIGVVGSARLVFGSNVVVTTLPFGGIAAASSTVDSAGYVTLAPGTDQVLSIQSAASVEVGGADAPLNAGHLYSFFSGGLLVQAMPGTSSAAAPLFCDDSAPPVGPLWACDP